MGLEPIGLARANLDDVWVDPADYQDHLCMAVEELASALTGGNDTEDKSKKDSSE